MLRRFLASVRSGVVKTFRCPANLSVVHVLMTQLTFSWLLDDKGFTPTCVSSQPAPCPLACVLIDDGGLNLATTIQWIDVGLQQTVAVTNGDLACFEWGREAWAATIEFDGVTVYSLHDETVCAKIELARFHNALSAWKRFLTSKPSENSTATVSI